MEEMGEIKQKLSPGAADAPINLWSEQWLNESLTEEENKLREVGCERRMLADNKDEVWT